MPSLEPLFSLILTTVGTDRITELHRLVRSLQEQTLQGLVEVVFVYQTNDGTTPSSIREIAERLGECRLITVPVTNLSAARNIGLAEARGRWIGFPDDDCWYSPATLSAIVEAFEQAQADAISLHVMDPESGRTLGRRPKDEVHAITYASLFRLPISVGLFVSRESILQARARFDTSLGVGAQWGAAEETDFVHTLLRSGSRCIYDGRISIFHAVLPKHDRTEVRKAYKYGAGFGVVAMRFLRNGTVGHVPHVVVALLRSMCAVVMYGMAGQRIAARAYVDRLRGFGSGMRHALFEGNSCSEKA